MSGARASAQNALGQLLQALIPADARVQHRSTYGAASVPPVIAGRLLALAVSPARAASSNAAAPGVEARSVARRRARNSPCARRIGILLHDARDTRRLSLGVIVLSGPQSTHGRRAYQLPWSRGPRGRPFPGRRAGPRALDRCVRRCAQRIGVTRFVSICQAGRRLNDRPRARETVPRALRTRGRVHFLVDPGDLRVLQPTGPRTSPTGTIRSFAPLPRCGGHPRARLQLEATSSDTRAPVRTRIPAAPGRGSRAALGVGCGEQALDLGATAPRKAAHCRGDSGLASIAHGGPSPTR